MEVNFELDVTLATGVGTVFPRLCSRCLALNPERNFKIRSRIDKGKLISIYSYDNVPICNSCYTRKYWTVSGVFRIIGWLMTIFGLGIGIAVTSVFFPLLTSAVSAGTADYSDVFVHVMVWPGIGLAILIGATIYRASNPRPVKMNVTEYGIEFTFENQKYGQMFKNMNT